MTYRASTFAGAPIVLECRNGTHDQQTAICLLDRDEYGLRGLGLPNKGTAIDIGAYTGVIAISLAIHGWKVVAVEPVPENQDMIARNARANHVQRKVRIDKRAASAVGWMDVQYGYEGSHRYVGNLQDGGTEKIRVPGATISDLAATHKLRRVDFLKIDCEGCEWGVLRDPATAAIPVIVGEVHDRPREEIFHLLPLHHVSFITDFVFQAVLP